MTVVQRLTDSCCEHGEGPVWDARSGRLALVDMLRGEVILVATDGRKIRRAVATVVAVIRPTSAAGWVLGVERGFALADADFQNVRELPPLWSGGRLRMNDGGCDPGGRFFCGSLARDGAPGEGTLYRLDPDGSVHTALEAVTTSNGIGWSPDGSRVYYIDSATQRIDIYDYDLDEAQLSNRRTLVEIPPEDGTPDGLAIDAEGGIWIALYGGGTVRRYGEHGALDEEIRLPVAYPTACAFGGTDLEQLYITSSTLGDAPGSDPLAGSVFVCEPGVAGLSVLEYKPVGVEWQTARDLATDSPRAGLVARRSGSDPDD